MGQGKRYRWCLCARRDGRLCGGASVSRPPLSPQLADRGHRGALLFTSALFGVGHLANKGATLSSGLAIMLEAGFLLGAAYSLTGRLWLPIGLHIGWNFTEGSVYGMQISGNANPTGLLRGSLTGSRLLTGGAFGPEGSIVAVLVCLALSVYLLYRTAQLGRIEPPAWYDTGRPAAVPL